MGEHVWRRKDNDKVTVHVYRCKGCGRTMKIRAGFDQIKTMAQHLGYPEQCPRPVPSTKELRQLWELARQWVTENQVRAPESIYQVDSVNIACQELAEGIVDLVGCYEDDIG